jgi:DNA-binding CsgD family transcriptional regulator
MNRSGTIITLLATAILMVACGQRDKYDSTIIRAESMTDTDPHGALTLLYGHKDSLCAGPADSALYELAYTEAVHGLDVKLTNSRYISESVAYFDRCSDKRRRARALVQLALCLYDNGQLHDAVLNMKIAEEAAAGTDDSFLSFRVAAALAQMNIVTGHHDLVMKYRRMELDAAQRTGSTNHVARAWNDMATEYLRINRTDSFMMCMNHCRPLLPKAGPEVQSLIRTNLGCYYMNSGDTARANRLLTMAYVGCPDRMASLRLGDIYAAANDMKRAERMWYDAADSDVPAISKSALKKLITLARIRNDEKSQLFLSDRLNNVYDRDVSTETASSLVELQNNYDSRRSERIYRAQMMRLGGAAAILIIALAGFLVYHRRRVSHYGRVINRQKLTLKELNAGYTRDLENYRALRQRLDELQQAREKDVRLIEEKTHELEKMQAQLAGYQNDRRNPEQWNMEDRLINADCVYALHRLASVGRTAEKQDWDALHQLTNSYDGRLNTLFAEHTKLSPNEINVTILTRLRFIPTEIAVLTGMSSQSVTNTRARLLQKIFGVKGGAKEFDDRIRNI